MRRGPGLSLFAAACYKDGPEPSLPAEGDAVSRKKSRPTVPPGAAKPRYAVVPLAGGGASSPLFEVVLVAEAAPEAAEAPERPRAA